ncbi:unnamed protein product [Amaranthus hypochondriacus]
MGEDNTTALKRHNSIPSAVLVPYRKHKTAPPVVNGNHRSPPSSSPPTSFPGVDFDISTLKQPPHNSYTSLKDMIPSSPSSILSPTPAATLAGISSSSSGSGYEISIRNRLVKQAAWAYLQPAVLTSPSSSSRRLCLSVDFFTAMVSDFRRIVSDAFTRVYDWLVDTLWLILCR